MCSECLDNQLQMSFNGAENQCCDTCKPGYGVTVNCSTNSQTVCEACIPGRTYSSPGNSLNSCTVCSTCGNSSHFVLHPCNVTHNTFCECPKGSYYDPFEDECKFCDLCHPGWGASRMCTSKHNTECSQCVTNMTYSSKLDPFTGCSPCTLCSKTEVTLQACSVTEDTICFSKYWCECSNRAHVGLAALRKHEYTAIFTALENDKLPLIFLCFSFLFLAQNIGCGYPLEPHQIRWF